MNAMMTTEGEQRRIDATREWLDKVRKTVTYAAWLEESAEVQFSRADGLKAINPENGKVRKSPYADAIPDAVAAHQDAGEALKAIAASARDQIGEAAGAIAKMDDKTEATCLQLYYIDAYDTWERVCVAMHYSYDGMMKLSRRALLHAYDVMPHYRKDPPSHATPEMPLPE